MCLAELRDVEDTFRWQCHEMSLLIFRGGGGGIRTHDTVSGMTVFKTVAFNHSATPPYAWNTKFSNCLAV